MALAPLPELGERAVTEPEAHDGGEQRPALGNIGLDLDLLEALGVTEPYLLHLAVEHGKLVLAVRPLAEHGHDVGNGAGGESQQTAEQGQH